MKNKSTPPTMIKRKRPPVYQNTFLESFYSEGMEENDDFAIDASSAFYENNSPKVISIELSGQITPGISVTPMPDKTTSSLLEPVAETPMNGEESPANSMSRKAKHNQRLEATSNMTASFDPKMAHI